MGAPEADARHGALVAWATSVSALCGEGLSEAHTALPLAFFDLPLAERDEILGASLGPLLAVSHPAVFDVVGERSESGHFVSFVRDPWHLRVAPLPQCCPLLRR